MSVASALSVPALALRSRNWKRLTSAVASVSPTSSSALAARLRASSNRLSSAEWKSGYPVSLRISAKLVTVYVRFLNALDQHGELARDRHAQLLACLSLGEPEEAIANVRQAHLEHLSTL